MIYSIQTIAPLCRRLHASGRRLILATGFFDLLHAEHRNFLKKAKATGDVLIVGVESDARARGVKGEGRPFEKQSIRCQHLLALDLLGSEPTNVRAPSSSTKKGGLELSTPTVDYVIALPDNFDHFEAFDSLMSAIRPDIYAVSSHTDHQKSKLFLTEKYGGQLLVVHSFNPKISTTKLLSQKQL